MATRVLPEKYRLVERVTIKKNTKLAVGMNAVVFFVLVLFVIGFLARYAPTSDQNVTFTIEIIPLMIAIFGIIAILTVHEFVHGIFIRHYTKAKVKYGFHGIVASAGSPDFYFTKKEYIIVALAPFFIINIALAVILAFIHGAAFIVVYWILAFHFTGCVGDIYIVLKLRKYKPDTFIRDSGPEMEFYTE